MLHRRHSRRGVSPGDETVGMVDDLLDPRREEPPYVLDERPMLEGWLEFHRTTLLLKCEGLDDAARKARPIPTSLLSLHGLVRHMADVERNWFRRTLLSEPTAPPIFYDPAIEDSELVPLDDAASDETWIKPARNQFRIDYHSGEAYEPDFVIETKTKMLICEVKAQN